MHETWWAGRSKKTGGHATQPAATSRHCGKNGGRERGVEGGNLRQQPGTAARRSPSLPERLGEELCSLCVRTVRVWIRFDEGV